MAVTTMKKVLFTIVSLISLTSFHATASSLSKVKNDYYLAKRKVGEIEKKIEKKNLSYVEIVKRRQVIDLEIYETNKEFTKQEAKIKKYSEQLQVEYRKALLQELDSDSVEDIIRRKLLLSSIVKKKNEVSHIQKNLQSIRTRLNEYSNDYQKTKKYEDELFTYLRELELLKNDYVEKYVQVKDKYTKARADATQRKKVARKKKRAVSTNVVANFTAPISQYLSKERKKKGITYKTKVVEPVLASKDGVVVHTGSLANYGNVIMIDHGQDIRSIYLGNFSPTVSKGKKVKQGDKVGQIIAVVRKDLYSNLYFDIRKKNKILNTENLIANNN